MEKYKCRFCWDEFDKREDVISPCQCKSDMKYVCRECFSKQLNVDNNVSRYNECPTCKTPYKRDSATDNQVSYETMTEMIMLLSLVSFLSVTSIYCLDLYRTVSFLILTIVYFLTIIHVIEAESYSILFIVFLYYFLNHSDGKVYKYGVSSWIIFIYGFLSYKFLSSTWLDVYETKMKDSDKDGKKPILDRELGIYMVVN